MLVRGRIKNNGKKLIKIRNVTDNYHKKTIQIIGTLYSDYETYKLCFYLSKGIQY